MAFTVQNKATIDGAASANTVWFDLRTAYGCSMTIVVPNGPQGSLAIEGSDDPRVVYERDHNVAAVDSTVEPSVITTLGTATDSLTLDGTGFNVSIVFPIVTAFVRVAYTRTAGTGTINVFVTGK